GVGRYQGVTKDHWVEVDLPSDSGIPTSASAKNERPSSSSSSSSRSSSRVGPLTTHHSPLTLVATGWIHPTDSSINRAIAHGKHDLPRSLSLEAPDGKGGWRVARSNLGFPLGK